MVKFKIFLLTLSWSLSNGGGWGCPCNLENYYQIILDDDSAVVGPRAGR